MRLSFGMKMAPLLTWLPVDFRMELYKAIEQLVSEHKEISGCHCA